MTEIHPVSVLLSISRLQGFLLRYVTLFYLNLLQNGKLLNLEVQKNCLEKVHFTTQIIIIQALFLEFQIQQLAISKSVEVGKSCIPPQISIVCSYKSGKNKLEISFGKTYRYSGDQNIFHLNSRGISRQKKVIFLGTILFYRIAGIPDSAASK